MMKKILMGLIFISITALLASCSLPEVTPPASTTDASSATSTAPIPATAIPPTATALSGNVVITAANAAQIAEIAKAPANNVQGLVWAMGSQSLTVVTQNTSGNDQIFSASILQIPNLAPDAVWAAPAGTQRLSVSPDGKTAAAISSDMQSVTLVDITSGKTLQTIQPGFGVMMATFAPDGKYLAVTQMDDWKTVVYDIATASVVNTFTGFQTAAPVFDAGFAGNGDWIVWHARGTIQLQNIASGALGSEMNHEDFVSAFTLSPDGALLASGSAKTINGNPAPVVILWDTATSSESKVLTLTDSATALSFSPDGKLLAVALGSSIQIWDVTSGTLLTTLPGNSNFIYHVDFSLDGKYLVSSAQDNQITLWGVSQ